MSSTMNNEFPSYLQAFFPNKLSFPIFNLGAHTRDMHFTVTVDLRFKNKPLMVLDNFTNDGNVLAVVGKPNIVHATHKTEVQVGDTTITLINLMGNIYRSFMFSLKLDSGREKFEWRPTQGNEVCNMFKHAKGFKLVRLDSKGPGDGKGGKRDDRHVDETSDGKEVVAVWATEKSLVPSSLTPTNKPFKFELRASGKSGELGSQFGYFALATALKIWSYDVQGVTYFSTTPVYR
ncbi:hypothetical protein F5Y00DRAFT_248687 [Daldinia vernicosa]|uniref:uncharacterized protein n=1 Tax=Daldinia vernicosa TaxID=114800 RepID=UPI002007231C|nr:uncharacterized protein F5Y00DRAFT_248687 [Daldinia vernicosa]KAI0844479.1 hypothetical protein F5Y00DRAFT_248687 [Daldinia vernicosa]